MFQANIKIIAQLKHFVDLVAGDAKLLKTFSTSDRHFTRSRKLPFSSLVLLITRLCKKTLSVELEQFFAQMQCSMTCSVSAFCQQRRKLKPLFFYCWNQVLQRSFYLHASACVKHFKGYRVIAADGSNLSLVNTPALRKHFGGQGNQNGSFVLAKTFYHYDVLNDIIVNARIEAYRYGEVKMAYDAVSELQPDMLMLYDRNFGSYKMIALHLWQEQQIPFVIRAKENLREVKAFLKTGQSSALVKLQPQQTAIEGLRKSGFVVTRQTLLCVRLVRVELPGSVEVLITNLLEQDGHKAEEFKDLYAMRWAVETNIGIQKNILQLECISGLSVEAVLQDFYATVMMTNLHAILIKDAQQSVAEQTTHYKYPMKVNKNKSFGKLKGYLVSLFVRSDVEEILKELHDHFIREPIPVRKGRTFKRVCVNTQSRSKHKTFTNYKPSY